MTNIIFQWHVCVMCSPLWVVKWAKLLRKGPSNHVLYPFLVLGSTDTCFTYFLWSSVIVMIYIRFYRWIYIIFWKSPFFCILSVIRFTCSKQGPNNSKSLNIPSKTESCWRKVTCSIINNIIFQKHICVKCSSFRA